MSPYIGVLCGAFSNRIYAVINPDDDAELDNPRFRLIQNEDHEPVLLLRIDRARYMECQTMDEVATIVRRQIGHQ